MFSDRFWIVKAAAALGLFALLCHRTAKDLAPLRPEAEQAVVDAESLKGTPIHFWARKIVAVAADGFDIETKVGRLHVVTPGPPPSVGEVVTFKATVLGARRVEATDLQINAHYDIKRGLNYALSVVVVLAFLWTARRHFRVSLSDGVFRSRY